VSLLELITNNGTGIYNNTLNIMMIKF